MMTGSTSEEDDFQWLRNRNPRTTSKTSDSADEQAPPHPPEKTEKRHGAAFSFAVFHADRKAGVHENYFNVRGEKRHGLLIDPGAASGLIGSDTLKELMDHCIHPLGRSNEVVMDHMKSTPVSGISGGANHTLGEVTLPLQAGGQSITFTAEVIGGEGSMCPALVGNPTLRKMDASIFANWFTNGDGLMMVGGRNDETSSKHYRLFRLLLTESGHYILPTDYEASAKVSKETQKEIVLFSHKIALESIERWSDVHDRVKHCFMTKTSCQAEQTGGDRGEPSLQQATEAETRTTATQVIPPNINQEKNIAFAEPEVITLDADAMPTVSQEHANLVEKPPTTLTEESTWTSGSDSHTTKPDLMHYENDSATLAIHLQDDEAFPPYTEDQLPENADHTKLKRRYRALPEEFYSKTGMKPVTPWNFRKWMQKTKGKGLRWHAWELFSGTGRLSLILLMAGLIVGFPVDYRYGWDLSNREHQQMLLEAQREFKPGVVHIAPDCGPWSVSSSSKDPDVRMQERLDARPSLEFTQKICEQQSLHHRGYNMEQPYGSALFQEDRPENPLHLQDIQDHRKRQRIDQCMLGAADELQQPIQKATGFGSNMKWKRTAIRCSGHRGRPHAHLQGCGPDGLTRTSRAAAYPRAMCQKMRQDIVDFLYQKDLLRLPSWPKSLQSFATQHFYECTRCQLGRACPPNEPHTYVPGECRYGRRGPPEPKTSRDKNKEKVEAPPLTPTDLWKERADRENLQRFEVSESILPMLDDKQKHYLKQLLLEVTHNTLNHYKGQDHKMSEGLWIDHLQGHLQGSHDGERSSCGTSSFPQEWCSTLPGV